MREDIGAPYRLRGNAARAETLRAVLLRELRNAPSVVGYLDQIPLDLLLGGLDVIILPTPNRLERTEMRGQVALATSVVQR